MNRNNRRELQGKLEQAYKFSRLQLKNERKKLIDPENTDKTQSIQDKITLLMNRIVNLEEQHIGLSRMGIVNKSESRAELIRNGIGKEAADRNL